jgi:hypothetical protein
MQHCALNVNCWRWLAQVVWQRALGDDDANTIALPPAVKGGASALPCLAQFAGPRRGLAGLQRKWQLLAAAAASLVLYVLVQCSTIGSIGARQLLFWDPSLENSQQRQPQLLLCSFSGQHWQQQQGLPCHKESSCAAAAAAATAVRLY